jgi:hypothetical protein
MRRNLPHSLPRSLHHSHQLLHMCLKDDNVPEGLYTANVVYREVLT